MRAIEAAEYEDCLADNDGDADIPVHCAVHYRSLESVWKQSKRRDLVL